jgi:glycosyltransferase involved in cell wall biosynthesis
MKILVLGNCVGLGGAQTAFRNFVKFLLRDGVEVAVIAICNGDTGLSTGDAHLWTLAQSGTTWRSRLAKAFHVGRAAWLARSFAPDVFVSVGLARTANVIARALGSSCYTIAQDFIFGRSVDDPLLKSAASVFRAIGVQAPSMVAALRESGFKSRPVNWIPCLPESPIEGLEKHQRTPDGTVRLAYFGRLAANKGLDLILEALCATDLALTVKLDIWGTGAEGQRLSERCGELGLAPTVKFLGGYPKGERGARLMCEYDAMVLPSTGSEGLPLILLEAMAYGLPFMATDVGAVRDCCEGNEDSILVEPRAASLRQGLRETVRRVLAQEFKPERLRQYHKRRFTYSLMVERWRQCLYAPEAFFNAGQ